MIEWVRPYPVRRPYCAVNSIYRAELAVASDVIEELLTVFRGTDLRLEFWLSPSCRVDIACFRDGLPTLFIECKAVQIRPGDAQQAQRYLDAARARWPGIEHKVWMVGPSVSRRMPEPPDGISYVAFR